MKAASCEEAFVSALMIELVHDVWRKYRVPKWRGAILVPIPKLRSCDNWHGILLLGRLCQSYAGEATKIGGRGIA